MKITVRFLINKMVWCFLAISLTGCVSTKPGSAGENTETREEQMQVIGEAEFVTVLPQKLSYHARIDTGATTCSISAVNIERFERDGKKWVRFMLPSTDGKVDEKNGKRYRMEYPLVRDASIKRHGAEDQIRPTVKLLVRLGSVERRVDFTLTDRTKYTYPILVGRNLLEGNAVVDVSLEYTTKK